MRCTAPTNYPLSLRQIIHPVFSYRWIQLNRLSLYRTCEQAFSLRDKYFSWIIVMGFNRTYKVIMLCEIKLYGYLLNFAEMG